MSDDIDKALGEAMGEPEKKSTSKQTLRTPPVVAPSAEAAEAAERAAAAAPLAPTPAVSRREMELEIRAQILQEMLDEERAAKRTLNKSLAAGKPAPARADEPEEIVYINLPPQSNCLRIDGREYYHGFKYTVRKSVADSMRDNMARAFEHDEQVMGRRAHPGGVKTSNLIIDKLGNAVPQPAHR